jgi:prophage tail gpP-like protein
MPDLRDSVTLDVAGVRYGGWTEVTIRRGLEQLAGAFEVAVTERWPNEPRRRPIRAGEACKVAIGGEVVITGWVDEVRASYDARQHRVAFRGRDAAGDLVDCSAPLGQREAATYGELVSWLASPFKVPVKLEVRDVPLPRPITIDPGDTVFDVIERVSRAVAMLVVSDGRGGLLITRAEVAARVPDRLELGRNIVGAEGLVSILERFSELTVYGQRLGNDEISGEDTTEMVGRARDLSIARYRPLKVVSEMMPQGDAQLQQRAEWEVRHREGRGQRATISVQGWRHAGGSLWQPNTLLAVNDAFLGLNRELLVVGVEFRLDGAGTRSVLTLTDRAAFDLIPLPPNGWADE